MIKVTDLYPRSSNGSLSMYYLPGYGAPCVKHLAAPSPSTNPPGSITVVSGDWYPLDWKSGAGCGNEPVSRLFFLIEQKT
ncbi:MAG: hypothetical protein FWF88_09515 [Peptococcaceae bacterium]|nr:hypothetical protein [Peptococcaceae bacterium]